MKKWCSIVIALAALLGGGARIAAIPVPARVEAASSIPQAQGSKGTILLVAGDEETVFRVYSVTGQLLRTVKVSAQARVTIDMPKGFYIVKCAGHWSHKVVVK